MRVSLAISTTAMRDIVTPPAKTKHDARTTRKQNWRDARASFMLAADDSNINNSTATVKRLSTKPSLDADLHLNPPGGYLLGTNRATAYGGWVYFRDLFVRTRGRGYKMNFEAFFSDKMAVSSSSSESSSSSSLTTGSSASGGSSSSSGEGVEDETLAIKLSTLFEVGRGG